MVKDMILVLDVGSDSNSYLAREIRALGVYSVIYPYNVSEEEFSSLQGVRGIIVNGGVNRFVDGEEVHAPEFILSSGIPLLKSDYMGSPVLPSDEDERKRVLSGFVFDTCGCRSSWNAQNFIDEQIALIREQVGDGKVLLALSGGVDSSVVAALLIRAIGDRLTCIHVNHGLLRKGESEQVISVFRDKLGANLIYVDATDRFLDRLAGVSDPQTKRHIIGDEFIRVFEEESEKLHGVEFLAQGTIYPDILESGSGTAKEVKAHHNVGGLPEDLKFKLVEPVKMLFKDEVRKVGKALGLPDNMVYRQPFPGPGLGVRCLGAITRDRLAALRESDAILREEFARMGLDKKVWQYFTVVPDITSTGVRGGKRSCEWVVIIRAVNTSDAITATVEPLGYNDLKPIVDRILNEVSGVTRVLYDLSPKPSATIEWE